MAVLDTAIHENTEPGGETWIAGSSPAMTIASGAVISNVAIRFPLPDSRGMSPAMTVEDDGPGHSTGTTVTVPMAEWAR